MPRSFIKKKNIVIYKCQNEKQFILCQKFLFKKRYRWVDSGRNILTKKDPFNNFNYPFYLITYEFGRKFFVEKQISFADEKVYQDNYVNFFNDLLYTKKEYDKIKLIHFNKFIRQQKLEKICQ